MRQPRDHRLPLATLPLALAAFAAATLTAAVSAEDLASSSRGQAQRTAHDATGAGDDADAASGLEAADKDLAQRLRQRRHQLEQGDDIVIPPAEERDPKAARAQQQGTADDLGAGDGADAKAAAASIPVFPCQADLDHDGDVDWWDLLIVLADYGRDAAIDPILPVLLRGDATHDGVVDFDDLLLVITSMGDCGLPED